MSSTSCSQSNGINPLFQIVMTSLVIHGGLLTLDWPMGGRVPFWVHKVTNPVLWLDSGVGFGHWLHLDGIGYGLSFLPATVAMFIGCGVLFAPVFLIGLLLLILLGAGMFRNTFLALPLAIAFAWSIGICDHAIFLRRFGQAMIQESQPMADRYLAKATLLDTRMLEGRGMSWAAGLVKSKNIDQIETSEAKVAIDSRGAVELPEPEVWARYLNSEQESIVGSWSYDHEGTISELRERGWIMDNERGQSMWRDSALKASIEILGDSVFRFDADGAIFIEKYGMAMPAGRWERQDEHFLIRNESDGDEPGVLTIKAGRLLMHDPSGAVISWRKR